MYKSTSYYVAVVGGTTMSRRRDEAEGIVEQDEKWACCRCRTIKLYLKG